jgi:hypothetical protein
LKRPISNALLVGASALLCTFPMMGQTNLGMVGIKSVYGAYLQEYSPSGELHASNLVRNTEETWFLEKSDEPGDVYAFYNYDNGLYLSKQGNCAAATSVILGPTEKWELVSGQSYGFDNAVALKSAYDGSFLGARNPSNDTDCGGEVDNWDTNEALMPHKNWPGWWVIEQATKPERGKDPARLLGDWASKFVNEITPADVLNLIKVLAGSK